jgi:hypothetical protein
MQLLASRDYPVIDCQTMEEFTGHEDADYDRKGGCHRDLFAVGEIRSNLRGVDRRRDRCGRASNRFTL